MAIESEGYFVLNDGGKDVYTRAGAFTVDANSYLVDPATGYLVQRMGNTGVSDGFQTAGNNNVKVPYDVAMPAKATTQMVVSGNLGQDANLATPQINVLKSNITYTTGSGGSVSGSTLISALDQYTGTLSSGVITFSGYKPDGTAMGVTPATDLTMDVGAATTLQHVLDYLNKTGEVQTVTLATAPNNVPDAGDYTLTYGGQTTVAPIAFGANAATIKTALETLSTVNVDDITVSGTLATGMTFTFADTLGDVGLITIDGTAGVALTDGGIAVSGTAAGIVGLEVPKYGSLEAGHLNAAFRGLWRVVLLIIPDFSRHSGINYVVLGETISTWTLAGSALFVAALRGGILMCIGGLILGRGELARIEE